MCKLFIFQTVFFPRDGHLLIRGKSKLLVIWMEQWKYIQLNKKQKLHICDLFTFKVCLIKYFVNFTKANKRCWNFPSASYTCICCQVCFLMVCSHCRLRNCSSILTMVMSVDYTMCIFFFCGKIWNIHKLFPCIHHHVCWMFRDAHF